MMKSLKNQSVDGMMKFQLGEIFEYFTISRGIIKERKKTQIFFCFFFSLGNYRNSARP